MYIRLQELLIRNAEQSDSRQLCGWWNDGAVMDHAGFPNGIGTTEEKVREELERDSDAAGRRLMIEKAGRPIGEMCYRNMGNAVAEIGIKICDFSERDKGQGTVLLRMLLKELFRMGYSKIILDTGLDNRRAQHVYEKLGFRRVAVHMDAFTDQIGNLRSSVDYELVKEDFMDFSAGTL